MRAAADHAQQRRRRRRRRFVREIGSFRRRRIRQKARGGERDEHTELADQLVLAVRKGRRTTVTGRAAVRGRRHVRQCHAVVRQVRSVRRRRPSGVSDRLLPSIRETHAGHGLRPPVLERRIRRTRQVFTGVTYETFYRRR